MEKRIRTNRIHSRILVSVLIVLVGLGIGISCSKDAGISSISPTSTDDSVSSRRLVGTKPAVGGSNYADFHPQTGVNYDPFVEMTIEERRKAIGGPEAATKYLQIIAERLAIVMEDDKLRPILHSVVPDIGEGAVHISEIAKKFPQLLAELPEGFKGAVTNGAIPGDLAQIIKDAPSDAEAIYKASTALFELELSVAVPPGQKWYAEQPIPVFFAPTAENVTSIEGVTPSLKPISMPVSDGPLYTCLMLNFDEDMLSVYRNRNGGDVSLAPPQHKSMWTWQNILNFFSVSPAYAHYPPYPFDDDPGDPHDPCYSENILQPVYKIVIFSDHEYWWQGDPEIKMGIFWRQNNPPVLAYTTDLPEVNQTNEYYTTYSNLRALHGTCGVSGTLEIVKVEEEDSWGDTTMGEWLNQTIPSTNEKIFFSPHTRLWVRRTNENAWTLP